MPTGLQTFAGDGRMELDVTTRSGGFTGAIWTNTNHNDSVPATKLDGDFIYVVIPPAGWATRLPQIRYENGRIYWGADTDGSGQPKYPLIPCLVYFGWA